VGGEVAGSSIGLCLDDTASRFTVRGTMDQHFADALASDLKDRLRVEIASEFQGDLRYSTCVAVKSFLKIKEYMIVI
jgi:hypothetical protein